MNLKYLTLFSLLLVIATRTMAQENPDRLTYLTKVEKYRKMKGTGAVLTVAGSILFVVGTVTLYNSTISFWGGESTGNPEAGAVATLFGAAGLGSGIPLWIVGAHNHRKYNKKLENLTVRLNANPQMQGLTFTYRF